MSKSGHFGELALITKDSPLEPQESATGFLFECAPDSPRFQLAGECIPLTEMIGSFPAAKQAAFHLTSKLLANEPSVSGVQRLTVFEEVVIRELARIFHLLNLDAWVQSHNFRICRFMDAGSWAEDLKFVQSTSGSTYRIEHPQRQADVSRKLLAHLNNIYLTKGGPAGLADRILRRAFPCTSRLLSDIGRQPASNLRRGGWWFYSTAYTFTRIGLEYDAFFPRRINYLVEDAATGGRPLQEQRRDYYRLYSFARWEDLPARRETSHAVSEIVSHLRNLPLAGLEGSARDLFLRSSWFKMFCQRLVPLGLFECRVLRRWLQTIGPEVVVVGNTAFEGYLLQQAREQGIPTVLLQHGVLGDFYQLMEQPVDHIVVRGNCFFEFLCDLARKKAVIFNFPGAISARMPAKRPGSDLLFLSAPYSMQPLFHNADLDDILGILVSVAASRARTLIVRVHPLEAIETYRKRLNRICLEGGVRPTIEYSQGGEMESLLQRSAVAVLYSSTVFLNCLAMDVPIVSFAWHDFSFRYLLEKHEVVRFAQNLHHLYQLVDQGLAGGLGGNQHRLTEFLAPVRVNELRDFFANLPGTTRDAH